MKLIDKDKIIAEIESRLHKYEKEYEELVRYEVWITAKEIEPKIKELKNLLSFINNLEVKEVDLEKENLIGTLEREVKIDAGGYPYIDCDIEFYDYDKDIPLAKEGDKVKIIVMKGE